VAILERPRPNAGLGSVMTRSRLPRSVFTAWVVSRLIGVGTLMVLGARTARDVPDYSRLVTWDGNWYRIIATFGYGPPPLEGQWSTWPFFPLFPSLSWLAHQVGSPYTATLLVCSNIAALVALAGVHRLGLAYSEQAATWAVWLTALFPGSITFVMAYPDSLYLAGLVWAFVLVSRRPALAGLAALVATASRPNAFLMLLPLAIAVLRGSPERRLARLVAVVAPSAVFLAAWCAWLWHATGNPLVFVQTKGAWLEATLLDLVKAPISNRYAVLHVVLAVLLALPFITSWRRQPLEWRVLAALSLLPSLGFGSIGLARYSICCFPLAIAAGQAAAKRSPDRLLRWPLVASTGLLVWFGLLITYWNYVP
jgi:hypothetical protein